MRERGLRWALLASTCLSLGHASPALADVIANPAIANPVIANPVIADPGLPVIVTVDVDSIPQGSVPPPLREADAAAGDALALTPAVDISPVGLNLKKIVSKLSKRGKRSLAGLRSKRVQKDVAELTPREPELGALYQPMPDVAEFIGESVAFACGHDFPRSPMRWETVLVEPDGQAQLEIKDSWLDASHCSVNSVSSARVAFKAIAWAGAEPWLFAMRDEHSITFLMSRTDDVSADAMVGAPFTVRGGFTRVTLPIGRWGSGSLVATLPSLGLKLPAKPEKQRRGRPAAASEPPTSEQPVQVAIELVQTMAETSPTLLIRRTVPKVLPSDR